MGLEFLKDHRPWERLRDEMEFTVGEELPNQMTTSPFSIYVSIGMIYEKYPAEYFAAYIDSGAGICTAKLEVFPKKIGEDLPPIAGRDFSKKILILKKGIKQAEILIRREGDTPWYKVKTPPIYLHDIGAYVLLGNNFLQTFKRITQENETRRLIFTMICDHKIIVQRLREEFHQKMLINFRSKRVDEGKLLRPKMRDQRRYGEAILQYRVERIKKEGPGSETIKLLKDCLERSLQSDITIEEQILLEDVKRKFQRNLNEDPLTW